MGASCVFEYRHAGGVVPDGIAHLHERLVALGARQRSTFTVAAMPHRPLKDSCTL